MYAIEIENLTKRYKNTVAVDGLSLGVQKGEIFTLLGVNGAGKTTTIKMLCGLLAPTSGDARLFAKESVEVKKMIALSPQENAVCRALTVKENLQLMAGIYGLSKAQTEIEVGRLAEKFLLLDVLKQKAAKLSGGYVRRLGIAMAMIGNPQILFLDEPTQGVDVLMRAEIWEMIKSLQGQTTVVLTTHDMEEAEHLADRVAVLRQGKLVACDTVLGLKTLAQTDDFTQAFVRIARGETV